MVFAVSDAIRRIFHLLFGTPQPIEWWLLGADLAIVFLIIWLDVPEKWHRRKLRKRVVELQPYMNEGQEIQRDVLVIIETLEVWGETAYAWTIKANFWSKQTSDFLAIHSKRASAAFLLVINSAVTDRRIYTPRYGQRYLSGEVGDCYQTLLSRLDNLRHIMERPEAYF
jgi:hypothetical protein